MCSRYYVIRRLREAWPEVTIAVRGDAGFGVPWMRFEVSNSRFEVSKSRFEVSDLRFQISDWRFEVSESPPPRPMCVILRSK
jgi:hypothetical protein